MLRTRLLAALLILSAVLPLRAEDKPKTVEELAEFARKSIVVIQVTGRDGKQRGLGTGFIVGDGLIATNLHVIGEARPVAVEMADGKRHHVTEIHATDRAADLAIVRIDVKNLTPLELGDSEKLKQGQAVVAIGHPRGLKQSVVNGVVSAVRETDGRNMIQVAIPIEQGNSGGPLLDMDGRVQGIMTLKSAVTANLGFAMPINDLKPLLKKPNPVPMSTWLTLGQLDPAEWKTLFGAHWKRRSGRITVEGAGEGFGGRSLCLYQQDPPKVPFEVAVRVKLDDEGGAAGLVFRADGDVKHYGFYPSGGGLRLTRFDGPDVLTWKILDNKPSPHYRPGDWNLLKVRVEKDKFLCYVNDQLVFESTDTGLTEGKVGLAKFRDTVAEFKNFQVGEKVGGAVGKDVVTRVEKAAEGVKSGTIKPEVVDSLVPDGPASMAALREKARELEQQAARLRQLALSVHQKKVQTDLVKLFAGKDENVDLVHAALLIARLDNDEVDVDSYRKEVERMGKDLAAKLPKDADDRAKLEALNKFFFTERGFHGGRSDYYNRANSYLNEVIDDREGLPITLSLLYATLGRKIGLNVVGVGMPGHFIVKQVPAKGDAVLIDVFDGGKVLKRSEAEKIVQGITGEPFEEKHLEGVTNRSITVRIVRNLMGMAIREQDADAMLRYLNVVLALEPDGGEDHWMRAVLRFQMGDRDGAKEDVNWVLEHEPKGVDIARARELRKILERGER